MRVRSRRLSLRKLRKHSSPCFDHPMPWDFWLIFLIVGIVIPWRGHARMRELMALPEVTSRDRIKMYFATILFQWLLTAFVAWRAFARGLSFGELAISSAVNFPLLALTIAGALLIAAAHWANVRRMASSDHPNLERLRALGVRLFPRSSFELSLFIVLSLTAGICEEFLFRGFVMAALFRAGLATWLVVLLSSAMFGVAHLYQGKGGSLGTGILGTLFALVRLAYRSLLPAMVWHAVLDIVAAVAGSRFLLGPATTESADRPALDEIHR
jgi:membrane protease YdiL (CAAX protease family)